MSRTHGWTRANLKGRGDRGVVRHAGVELQFVIEGEDRKLQAGKHADLAEDRGQVIAVISTIVRTGRSSSLRLCTVCSN